MQYFLCMHKTLHLHFHLIWETQRQWTIKGRDEMFSPSQMNCLRIWASVLTAHFASNLQNSWGAIVLHIKNLRNISGTPKCIKFASNHKERQTYLFIRERDVEYFPHIQCMENKASSFRDNKQSEMEMRRSHVQMQIAFHIQCYCDSIYIPIQIHRTLRRVFKEKRLDKQT